MVVEQFATTSLRPQNRVTKCYGGQSGQWTLRGVDKQDNGHNMGWTIRGVKMWGGQTVGGENNHESKEPMEVKCFQSQTD